MKKNNATGRATNSVPTGDRSPIRETSRSSEYSMRKKRSDSTEKYSKKPSSACNEPDKSQRIKFACDGRENNKNTLTKQALPSKSTADRKSLKSYGSVSSATSGKKSDKNLKGEVTEESEAVPLLTSAIQKQKEIIQAFQSERMEFCKRLKDDENKNERIIELRGRRSVPDGTRTSEIRSKCRFDDAYGTYMEEILHIWLNLIYCILNLRINAIKVLSRSGKDIMVPNLQVEKEILSRAIESVRLISLLKMKSLGDTLDLYRFHSTPRKGDNEILEAEGEVAASFVKEMEYVGNGIKDILYRPGKANAKMARA